MLTEDPMPGTRWFVGATANYAERVLVTTGAGRAIVARSQTRGDSQLTFDELRSCVARARMGLQHLGVGKGDRVVAYLPNIPETVVLFLATASLGAVFSSCAPEFGVRRVVDRFGQIEPKLLVAVDGYRFRDKAIDRRDDVDKMRARLPSLEAVVSVPYLGTGLGGDTIPWDAFMCSDGPLEFDAVDVDHPLYVLYSSGTTGPLKALIHSHGRILPEHLKVLALHFDLELDDTLLTPATTSWMVWKFSISAMMLGTAIVCFDGDPLWPDPLTIWHLAEETGATEANMGAALFTVCDKAGLRPGDEADLSRLRMIGSTGSPLSADGFRWVYDAVSPTTFLHSGSGGTDVCSGFVGGNPLLPVVAGEIACRYLGAAVVAYDDSGIGSGTRSVNW